MARPVLRFVTLFAMLLTAHGALAVVAMAASPATVQIDFGSASKRSDGAWNNVTDTKNIGRLLEDALDTNLRPTSLRLEMSDRFAGFNSSGFAGESPLGPAATGDSFYLEASADPQAEFDLAGLVGGETYTLTFFGSRLGGSELRTARYTVEGTSVELNAFDNQTQTVTIENAVANEAGRLTVTVSVAEGNEYAYLGALQITGQLAEAAEYRDPADALDGPPLTTAAAWAIADAKTGELLWSKNPVAVRNMASTTKIMTAWIVLELAAGDAGLLDQVITVSERASKTGGSSAKIETGEKYRVADMLYGLLLPSGNDAAVALAEHVGDRFDPPAEAAGSKQDGDAPDALARFVAEMNRRAAKLGMEGTHYFDPHGNSANRSCARDLLLLARQAMKNDRFRGYVNTRTHQCDPATPDGATRVALWKNTNQLLGIDGFDGIKTGTTGAAGECLVSSGHRGEDHLYVVVLGAASKARYVDSRNLYRWAWRQRAK